MTPDEPPATRAARSRPASGIRLGQRPPASAVEPLEGRLVRPDGRTVAWTECGVPDGRPMLRVPGTPGSRYTLPVDKSLWLERGLRVITVERPGFGASTRLPGRGFTEHADDLAAVVDELGIDRLPVFGGSGAAPHALAFAARHPDRAAACTILDGAAPMTDDEVGEQVEANVIADRLARAGEIEPLRELLAAERGSILADPVAALHAIMDGAPNEDHELIAEPDWLDGPGRGFLEALAPGVDGWVDELLAIDGDWADLDLDAVTASVTWWHSESDRNCPISSARRLVARLRNARFVVLDGAGHLAGHRREAEILDELLARAGRVGPDPLTGLPIPWPPPARGSAGVDPNHLEPAFRPDLAHPELADGRRVALIAVDLDEFRRVNERYGDVFGDRVLREVAARLRLVADGRPLYRYQGDAFLLVVDDDRATAFAIARQALEAVVLPIDGVTVAAHAGIALSGAPIELDRLEVRVSRALLRARADPDRITALVAG